MKYEYAANVFALIIQYGYRDLKKEYYKSEEKAVIHRDYMNNTEYSREHRAQNSDQ